MKKWLEKIVPVMAVVLVVMFLVLQSAQAKTACLIKGNVTKKGKTITRIYHLPGTQYYKTVKINAKEGDKWFCTEKDAKKAGFRKSK